ncbi:hypothetical protein ACA910_012861 [Epithemia clementina (nom. ined.)]
MSTANNHDEAANDLSTNGKIASQAESSPQAIAGNNSDGSPSAQKDRQQQREAPDPRQVATKQAEQVLSSLEGGETYLNGFNLLQVIANPRGNPQDLTFSSSSYHGRYGGQGLTPSRHGQSHSRSFHGGRSNPSFSSPQSFSSAQSEQQQQLSSSQTQPPSDTGTNSSSDLFLETYYQIESTLVHATEQLEFLNQGLEEWSRKILEEDPYSAGDDLPEAQLRELPAELNTTPTAMNQFQEYLAKSGLLAHKFREIQGVQEQMEQNRPQKQSHESHDMGSDSVSVLREEIPEIFWQDMTELDLTHPGTFQSLFFAEKKEFEASPSQKKIDKAAIRETSVHTWFPLVPPDSLNPCLDRVEIALLDAVREQSHAFFEESIRFATLQEWIKSLLDEVTSLQTSVDSVLTDSVRPMQTVPSDYAEMQEWQSVVDLLDSANELVRCKASIAGHLSAADDLTALEQVSYGRQKLKQGNLMQLHALQGAAKQLDQYEELIVTNLREELVESFLDWNANMSTSAMQGSSYSMSKMGTPATGTSSSAQTSASASRVVEIVQALANCCGLRKTVQAYNTRLQDVMRLTVRTVVAEFADSAPTGASGMTHERFLDCLDMTMEQLLALLSSAAAVDAFCAKEGFSFQDDSNTGDDKPTIAYQSDQPTGSISPMSAVVIVAAELSSKSISELLRLRKDAHTLLSLDEMKRLWDKCVAFASHVEELTKYRAATLRSTLLAQAKSFIERRHDSNMSALVAALDSERWTQCDVSIERQTALTRLSTGRALVSRSADADNAVNLQEKQQEVEVNGVRYKVVWSCLLLVEMVISNLSASAHFTGTTLSIVGKVAELLRLFNSRTTQLVLGAKAIHSAARLKSINAKHLSLVTQCLGMVISVLPNIRASLMAQLPTKQHRLLNDIDQIKKEYGEHNEKVLNKFVTIIGGIIEHHLAPKLAGTDFDARARDNPLEENGSIACCVFLEGISSNTRKMHHVLHNLLPPEHLQDVFSRIFAYVDTKIPSLLSSASRRGQSQAESNATQKSVSVFDYPQTDEGKQRMLLEAEAMTLKLNALDGVQPWDFTLVNVLERSLEYNMGGGTQTSEQDSEAETEGTTVPSDTEDQLDSTNGDSEVLLGNPKDDPSSPASASGEMRAKDDVASTAELLEGPNDGEPKQNGDTAEQRVDDGGPDKPPEYPVEVTTL